MEGRTATRDLVLLIATGVVLTAGLHWLGSINELQLDWSDPIGWLNNSEVDAAVAATLRLVGLTVGYWMTISTGLYGISARSRRAAPQALAGMVTLPAIRRLVDRALATALAATIVTSPLQPVLAEEPPPPAVVFDINTDGVPVPLIRPTERASIEEAALQPVAPIEPAPTSTQTLLPLVLPVPSPALPTAGTSTSIVSDQLPDSYNVVKGDNLWAIAERRVGLAGDLDIVSAYWRRLVAVNRNTLRSGDPNLIYPGEMISLPPIEVSP